MNILFVKKEAIVGGLELRMATMCGAMARRGHNCRLAFLAGGPLLERLPDGVRGEVLSLADIMRSVGQGAVDVVQTTMYEWKSGLSAAWQPRRGTKLVVMVAGQVQPRWNSSTCSALVACSRSAAELQAAVTDAPVHVVMNGVDTDRFAPASDATNGPPVVAWVGRAADLVQKRIQRLAAVAPSLRAAGLRVWIASPDGPEEVDHPCASELAGLAEFWEHVHTTDMPAFLNRVANSGGCVLSTTSFEGLPMSLLEAQACGCPVIGPDVRGVNECVRPEHGGLLYAPETDPGALAQIVADAVADQAAMTARRADCRHWVERCFSLDRMVQSYLDLYDSVPARAPWPRRLQRGCTNLIEPLLAYDKYWVERRYPAAQQVAAAEALHHDGHHLAAWLALRAAARLAPTMFMRPGRLSWLLRCWRRAARVRR